MEETDLNDEAEVFSPKSKRWQKVNRSQIRNGGQKPGVKRHHEMVRINGMYSPNKPVEKWGKTTQQPKK